MTRPRTTTHEHGGRRVGLHLLLRDRTCAGAKGERDVPSVNLSAAPVERAKSVFCVSGDRSARWGSGERWPVSTAAGPCPIRRPTDSPGSQPQADPAVGDSESVRAIHSTTTVRTGRRRVRVCSPDHDCAQGAPPAGN